MQIPLFRDMFASSDMGASEPIVKLNPVSPVEFKLFMVCFMVSRLPAKLVQNICTDSSSLYDLTEDWEASGLMNGTMDAMVLRFEQGEEIGKALVEEMVSSVYKRTKEGSMLLKLFVY